MSDAARVVRPARARSRARCRELCGGARGGRRRDGGRRRGRRRGRAGRRRDRHRAGTPFAAELAGRLDEVGLARNGRPRARAAADAQSAGARSRSGPGSSGSSSSRRSSATDCRAASSRRGSWSTSSSTPSSRRASRETGHFLIRDVHHGAYGVVYPLLIAPAWRAVRLGAGRLRRGEDDRLRADVADRDPGVLPRAPSPDRRSSSLLAAAAGRRRAVADVHGHADDGDGLLSALRLRGARARARARTPDDPAAARAARRSACLAFLTRSQAIVLDPGRRDGAASARVARPPAPAHARRLSRVSTASSPPASSACSPSSSRRGHSPYDVLGSYSVTGPRDLPARPGAEVGALPRRRARPLSRHRPVRGARCCSPSSAGRSTVRSASFSPRHCR